MAVFLTLVVNQRLTRPTLQADIDILFFFNVTQAFTTKRDDISFPIVNIPSVDGTVDLVPSYGIYISQLVRFARICNNVSDFNGGNFVITGKNVYTVFMYLSQVRPSIFNVIYSGVLCSVSECRYAYI